MTQVNSGNNRLPILASEIRQAHADGQEAAQTAAERAIVAGHALIEAKQLVGHGGWLGWLREDCALAERTAQLYMRIAKSGLESETVADLGIQAAAKAMVLYLPDPFADTPPPEMAEWLAFSIWLSGEGWHPEGSAHHAEWLKRKGWSTPSEWMGEAGDRLRAVWGMNAMPAKTKRAWFGFWAENCARSPDELETELQKMVENAPDLPRPGRKRRRATS